MRKAGLFFSTCEQSTERTSYTAEDGQYHTHSGMSSKSNSRKIAGSLRGIFSSRKHTSSTVETWSSSNSFGDPAPVPYELPPPYTPADARPATAQQSPSEPSPPWRPSSRPPSIASSSASGDIPSSALRADDRYDFLAYFDTIFLIDDSSSMLWSGCMSKNGDKTKRVSRWREVKTVLQQIVPVCAKYDKDGVDIYFLNHEGSYEGVTTCSVIDNIFETVFPAAKTPTARRISEILEPRVKEFETAVRRRGAKPKSTGLKPVNLIVITDGAPDPYPSLPDILASFAQRLDAVNAPSYQFGIQFFQVGNEPAATKALKELDDNLKPRYGSRLEPKKPIRDFIDTVTFDDQDDDKKALSPEGILKVVLGAISRKQDAKLLLDKANIFTY